MSPEGWEKLLVRATEEVMEKVSRRRVKERGKAVGVGASGDVTLEADKEAEEVLLRAIQSGGEVRVLSEEAGSVGKKQAPLLAVVDPLDGSSNFKRGIPFYCTSVALVEGGGLEGIKVGVIRDLVTGDVFCAARGSGATKTGRPIRTSGTQKLQEAVVGVDLSRGSRGLAESLAPLAEGARRQVHFGANALELCYLADGRIDGFVDMRGLIRMTDFAAAYLIAREAGAVFSDPLGQPPRAQFDLTHRLSFIASANAALHKEILEVSRKRHRELAPA